MGDKQALISLFVREPIRDKVHEDRLEKELSILEENNFIQFIIRVTEIYRNSINGHLNLLRGSAGSLLLFYYLGINKIDPVKYNITLSRFLNKLSPTLPDIDIDVPQKIKDDIMNDIITNNKDTIRITSNYQNENNIFYDSLIREDPSVSKMHNSAIVIFSNKDIELIKENKLSDIQIRFTKEDVSTLKLKKIDLLSNIALEQLNVIGCTTYDFDDKKVYDFIAEDNGIGIPYAETSMIQYVIKILKPKNIEELSTCLAIVRPFASRNISENMNFDDLKQCIVYDDDLINLLMDKLNMTEEMADKTRRLFKKNVNFVEMKKITETIEKSELEDNEKNFIKNVLSKAHLYGFCKAHSINYAILIYMLYYCKYYNPKMFWKSTIMTIKGHYNDWVYIRKGLECGLKFKGNKKANQFTHFIHTGYWLNDDFMTRCYFKINNDANAKIEIDKKFINTKECEFRGVVAGTAYGSTRYKKQQTIITIGYDNNKFIDLYMDYKKDFSRAKQVFGTGYYIDGVVPHVIIAYMKIY